MTAFVEQVFVHDDRCTSRVSDDTGGFPPPAGHRGMWGATMVSHAPVPAPPRRGVRRARPAHGFAAAPPDSDGTGTDAAGAAPTTTIDNSFLDTKRDITECLNNSVDLPNCGVEPTEAGARGGALQGVTFGVLALGIAFICWRVVRSIKARDAALESTIS